MFFLFTNYLLVRMFRIVEDARTKCSQQNQCLQGGRAVADQIEAFESNSIGVEDDDDHLIQKVSFGRHPGKCRHQRPVKSHGHQGAGNLVQDEIDGLVKIRTNHIL